MHASGESARTIAATLNVSPATIYRVLADGTDTEEIGSRKTYPACQ
jgi:IS30 family transposase